MSVVNEALAKSAQRSHSRLSNIERIDVAKPKARPAWFMGDARFWRESCRWWLVYLIAIGGYYSVVSGGCAARSAVTDPKDHTAKYRLISSTY